MAKTAAKKSKSATQLVPLGDRVVVKRAEVEEQTAGGIFLPDSAQDKPQRGEVVAVGDGYIRENGNRVPLTVKEGDRVLFSSYAGSEVDIDGDKLLIMDEADILAIV